MNNWAPNAKLLGHVAISEDIPSENLQAVLRDMECPVLVSPCVPYGDYNVFALSEDAEYAESEGLFMVSLDEVVAALASMFQIMAMPNLGPWGHENDSDRYVTSKAKSVDFAEWGVSEPLKMWRDLNAPGKPREELLVRGNLAIVLRSYPPTAKNPWGCVEMKVTQEGEILESDTLDNFGTLTDIMAYLTKASR